MSGFEIVLSADRSLMTEFRGEVLFGFLTCAPKEYVPEFLYDRLFAPTVPREGLEAKYAQYSLRKVEATLSEEFVPKVVHPNCIEEAIGDETEVVGLEVMDPLGIGPVTSSFAFSEDVTPFNNWKFRKLINKLPDGDYKLVVGGAGAWQFKEKEKREEFGIDHILLGEIEKEGKEAFRDIIEDEAPEVIELSPPEVDEIPPIENPSINSLVEVSRGCGRGCSFCDPTLSKRRDFPIEKIAKEWRVIKERGNHHLWLHSDDFLLYGCNSSEFYPNREKILELINELNKLEGLESIETTHFSLSAAAADPELISELSSRMKKDPGDELGVQPGIETGSPRLLRKYMPNKAKPFSPEEWPKVVEKGIQLLNENNWYPACTLMVGLPNETREDVEKTIELVERLVDKDCVLAPLFFTPLGGMEEEEQFIVSDLSEKQFELVEKCWKHNLSFFSSGAWKALSNQNLFIRMVATLAVKAGSKGILHYLKKFGRQEFPEAEI